IPPIPCYPDELNQVWTNLIHNALQAMDHKGRMEITADQTDTHVIVSVTDSGCGIPKENLERIFNAFFTTKARGQGSGLGLGICKKIVEKHNGTITVESEVGRTVFRVALGKY
ncbi:MAG: GHKL domain-containing protein, partial [Desulfamplus sp.]|nr:GHKL domain-containing protein [Desulfamplus sp.]